MDLILPKKTQIGILVVYLAIGIIFCIQLYKVENIYTSDYIYVLTSYFLVAGVWIGYIFRYGYYIFDPSTMIATITIITFSIEPLISMITRDTLLSGTDVYDGCIKATTIYIIGMCAFLWIYYHKFTFGKNNEVESQVDWDYEYCKNSKLIFLAYIFVLIGVGVSLVDLLMQGFSLQYILSAGSQGTLETSEDSLGVFLNLRYFMLPGFLYMDAYSDKKIIKNFLRFVAIMCFFMRNKRWIIVLLILSPIVFYYIRRQKKPPLKRILIVSIPLVVAIGAMQYMRGISSSISAVDWSNFGLINIWGAFSGNFDLYKTLYGAVTYFPDEHFYTMGQQLVYLTLVTCIPRSIWPDKPVSIIDNELKVHFMGNGAVRGHWAYAQITEFYVEFGVIGVIVCMCIFAILCKKLRKCYQQPESLHDLVLSSVMFPMLMQFVIRGYMPINFWATFFMVLPIFIMKIVERVE